MESEALRPGGAGSWEQLAEGQKVSWVHWGKELLRSSGGKRT